MKINLPQKAVIILYFVVITLSCTFLPWMVAETYFQKSSYGGGGFYTSGEYYTQYYSLWAPPSQPRVPRGSSSISLKHPRLDSQRMMFQAIVITAMSVALFVLASIDFGSVTRGKNGAEADSKNIK